MTTKDRFNYLTFSDWNAMYHFITSEGDLYNPFLNKYAFTYNNDGAICVYDVTSAEAVELAVSYTHLTLPRRLRCRSRWSPYH